MSFFKDVGKAISKGSSALGGVVQTVGNVAGVIPGLGAVGVAAGAASQILDGVSTLTKPGGSSANPNTLTSAQSLQLGKLLAQGYSPDAALTMVTGVTVTGVGSVGITPTATKKPVTGGNMPQTATPGIVSKGMPSWQDILISTGGGALLGLGKELAGTENAGKVGASAVDSTINEWFSQHWHHLLMGLGAIWGLWKFVLNPQKGGRRGRR